MQTWVLLPEADRAEVSRFAKNFLPILFNLYGQPVAAGEAAAPRRAVLETIKTYLTITESQVSAGEGRGAVGCWKSQDSTSRHWRTGDFTQQLWLGWGPTQEPAAISSLCFSLHWGC